MKRLCTRLVLELRARWHDATLRRTQAGYPRGLAFTHIRECAGLGTCLCAINHILSQTRGR